MNRTRWKRLRDARIVAGAAARGAIDAANIIKDKGLSREHLWMLLAGGINYARAIASGDATNEVERHARLAVCKTCSSRRPHELDLEHLGYCGEPLVDRTASAINPTCGCPIDGIAAVKSKDCPQHKWVSLSVKGSSQ